MRVKKAREKALGEYLLYRERFLNVQGWGCGKKLLNRSPCNDHTLAISDCKGALLASSFFSARTQKSVSNGALTSEEATSATRGTKWAVHDSATKKGTKCERETRS